MVWNLSLLSNSLLILLLVCMMKQYLEFVVDGLLVKFGCKKEFNVEQPFKFMEQIAIETKGNFFEGRTVEYQKAKLNETLSFTDDF